MGFLRDDLVEISILAVAAAAWGGAPGPFSSSDSIRSRVAALRAPGLGRQLLPYVPAGSCLPHVRAEGFVWPGRRGFPFVRSAADVGVSVALLGVMVYK